MFPSALVLPLVASLCSAAGIDVAADTRADELVLQSANLGTDGASLLAFLRKQIEFAAHPDQINALIRDLGDDEFAVRERATERLAALGRAALPYLQRAKNDQKDKDPEVVHRAGHCIERIERGSTSALPGAVVRLLAVRRPPGGAETLLAYAPLAENDRTTDDIRNALTEMVRHDGNLAAMLKTNLGDPQPSRRALAAEALCRGRVVEGRNAARALLKDSDANVRLRVALTLTQLHDKNGIPVLIDLVATLPIQDLLPVEDTLFRMAGNDAPELPHGPGDAERKKFRDAWAGWWKAHGDGLDLVKIDEAAKPLGHTLIVLLDDKIIQDLDADNRQRWAIDNLRLPLDVQLLPNERVLVAEQEGNVVTERNLKGEIVWKKEFNSPLVAQRLPNGNTFLASKTVLTEIDKDGKELYAHSMPGGSEIMRAAKLDNGNIACVTQGNRFFRLDDKGRTLAKFQVNVGTFGGRIEVLRNGNVLVPEKDLDRVVEYSPRGKVEWEVKVSQPIAAVRLPNGNTLVTSMSDRRAVEVDRRGKEVWEYRHESSPSRVTRAYRR